MIPVIGCLVGFFVGGLSGGLNWRSDQGTDFTKEVVPSSPCSPPQMLAIETNTLPQKDMCNNLLLSRLRLAIQRNPAKERQRSWKKKPQFPVDQCKTSKGILDHSDTQQVKAIVIQHPAKSVSNILKKTHLGLSKTASET